MSVSRPLVSILIPVYNAELFLAACLDTIVSQTLKPLEIICINDGSTDSSLDILKSYAKKDPRFVIINKQNTGYGDSMNRALRRAKGEYIGIVEPDDWVAPEMFDTLYHTAEEFNADVVRCGHYRVRQNQPLQGQPECNSIIPQAERNVKTNLEHCPTLLQLPPAIWSALYRRKFLQKQGITFLPTPGASYQDLSFSFKVWVAASSVVILDQPLYYYRTDNASSSVNSPAKVHCVVEEYAEIETFLTERGQFAEFGSQMTAAKFRNYHWNFQRLGDKALAREFYDEWLADLRSASDEGLLRQSDFRPLDWRVVWVMLHFPGLAFRILRFRAIIKK